MKRSKLQARDWTRLWIAFGTLLAILLVASSVMNYVNYTRFAALRNTRLAMARQVSTVSQLIKSEPAAGNLSTVLNRMVDRNSRSLAWVQLLDRQGAVIARSGAAAAPAFAVDYVTARLRERQPSFIVRDTSAGTVVVETFPIRLPAAPSAPNLKLVSLSAAPFSGGPFSGSPGFVELASFSSDAGIVAWPARWSLILGTTAGLALLAALLVLAIRARRHRVTQRVEQQMDIAREVQFGLLPRAAAAIPDFQVAADWHPAGRVSGDFYDVLALDGQGAAFVFGDVSGKDVPAAMLASVIQGSAHASGWTRSAAEHKRATEQLNQLLCERASQERYASLFWGYFETQTGLLHYVNCGHCAPLLFRKRDHALRLCEGGPVLGLLPHARFEQGREKLEPGDVVVLYSDGIVEAANARGEEFGEYRLIAAVESNMSAGPDAIRDRILESVRAFTGSDHLDDDRTLLAMQYTGAAAGALNSQAA
ncbi:MAG TPA: PP2C family protein-serine/threonine phosphatase [Bryobacteraceae bacterium]